MSSHPAMIAAGVVGLGSVVAADLVTKSYARAHAPDVAQLADPASGVPQWVHHEHPGPRELGALIIAAPLALGGAVALGSRMVGAPVGLARTGGALLAIGGALNGVELLARGSNTNPINSFGVQYNVADLAIAGGVGAVGLAAAGLVLGKLLRR